MEEFNRNKKRMLSEQSSTLTSSTAGTVGTMTTSASSGYIEEDAACDNAGQAASAAVRLCVCVCVCVCVCSSAFGKRTCCSLFRNVLAICWLNN
jgi:hypothetical protein